ncbi:MAG: ComF family protein [Phycisphaerae bacterium]
MTRRGDAISTALHAAREGWRAMVDTVFPNECAACRRWIAGEAGLLCGSCKSDIASGVELPYCRRCARTISPLSKHDDGCPHCRSEGHWNVRDIARIGEYGGPLRDLVLAMKYAGNRRATLALGSLLAERLAEKSWIGEIDAFVPVPMHQLRRWQRPIDHALELATATSHALARLQRVGSRRVVPVRRAVVRRVRYEQSQARATSMTKRIEQIRDAFAPGKRQNPTGWCACIIDNVITSGATLHEVSRILRLAGAKAIYAAVIGRAELLGELPTHTEAIRATSEMLRIKPQT